MVLSRLKRGVKWCMPYSMRLVKSRVIATGLGAGLVCADWRCFTFAFALDFGFALAAPVDSGASIALIWFSWSLPLLLLLLFELLELSLLLFAELCLVSVSCCASLVLASSLFAHSRRLSKSSDSELPHDSSDSASK